MSQLQASSSSLNARMRRAVQQENQSIDAAMSTKRGNRSSSSKKQKKNPFHCGLIILVLSPIVIVLTVIYVTKLSSTSPFLEEQNEIQQIEEQVIIDQQRNINNIRGQQQQQQQQLEYDDVLVLQTIHGNIRIVMRPDLSSGSVDYVRRLVDNGVCRRCNFYRAEKPGILQGVMANREVPTNTVKGDCPTGLESVHNDCPEWDAQCGCHGPVMTKGSVAWAAGQSGGPDFFIDNYNKPADFWGTQHTNFGLIMDEESFRVIDAIFELPVTKGGMTMLKEPIHFDMSLEKQSKQ